MEDRDIVAAIVTHNQAGLEGALDKYGDAIYGYCTYLLADPVAAEDAVRDTFAVAWARLDRLRRPERLRPWLDAVACNECLRRMDAGARQVIVAGAGGGPDLSEILRDSALQDTLRTAFGGQPGGAAVTMTLTALPCSIRDSVLRLAAGSLPACSR